MLAHEKNTAAYKLFHRFYNVRIPEVALYSPETIPVLRHSSSDDPEDDIVALKSSRYMKLCAAGIAEHFSEGTDVIVISLEDKGRIYEDILQHLRDWLHIMKFSFAYEVPPVNDLFILDEYAQELHLYQHMIKNKDIGKDVSSKINSFFDRADRFGLARGVRNSAARALAKEIGMLPYESALTEILTLQSELTKMYEE